VRGASSKSGKLRKVFPSYCGIIKRGRTSRWGLKKGREAARKRYPSGEKQQASGWYVTTRRGIRPGGKCG